MYARASHPLEYIFTRAKKMYSRASHPLEYIFTRAKNVLKGVPPPWVHFYNGKKCTQGRPTPLSTFWQRQKMYSRASHPLEYIFTRAKNVLEGVPPPWVHFYKGKKCTGGRPTPFSTFLQGQKKCTQGRPTPLSTFLHCKKNVTTHVGRPWVHFLYSLSVKKMYWRGWEALEYIFILQKKCTQGGGTPLSTFSLLIPRQENVLKGVGPPPVHVQKKMYRHKGDVFLLYLFWGGGGFWAKKMYWRGWDPLGYIFFAVFPPPPLEPTWGGSQVHFQPSPPHVKNVHYIFGGPPLKLMVKGVGILQPQQLGYNLKSSFWRKGPISLAKL